jgi:hypothetical protein
LFSIYGGITLCIFILPIAMIVLAELRASKLSIKSLLPPMVLRVIYVFATIFLILLFQIVVVVGFSGIKDIGYSTLFMSRIYIPLWLLGIFLFLRSGVSASPQEGWKDPRNFRRGGLWLITIVTAILYDLYVRRMAFHLPQSMSGGCFVATAAAKGHPRFVGSRIDTNSAGVTVPITQQLITLKTFESLSKARRPRAHRALRYIYNRIGPPLAACIVHPTIADLAYLLLKPAEWFARAFVNGSPGK